MNPDFWGPLVSQIAAVFLSYRQRNFSALSDEHLFFVAVNNFEFFLFPKIPKFQDCEESGCGVTFRVKLRNNIQSGHVELIIVVTIGLDLYLRLKYKWKGLNQ